MAQKDKSLIQYLPNALTVCRLVLTIGFLAMILYAGRMDQQKPAAFLLLAFIIFVITGLTDIVDGKIARKYSVTSKFGRMVDPLADKVLVCGAFVCFAVVGQPILQSFSFSSTTITYLRWITVGLVVTRELFVTILRHVAEARGVNFAATVFGKIKMALQTFSIGTVMIKWAYVSRPWGDWFTLITYLLMLTFTIISGVQSITRPRK
ncbi:MAG: CDP-alcohol phosphatidyltransferase family protein [Planctomycetota bacterium]